MTCISAAPNSPTPVPHPTHSIATQLLSDKKKSLRKILLAPFSVFAEWSSLHDEYLMSTSSASQTSFPGTPSDSSLYSNVELLRVESRARSSMRSAINMLDKSEYFDVPAVPGGGGGGGGGGGAIRGTLGVMSAKGSAKVLPEHLRLRGFLPLASHYEHFFAGGQPIPKTPQLYSEDEARDVRLRILKAFVRDWLVPCAQREAVEGEERRREQEGRRKDDDNLAPPRGGGGGGGGGEKKKQLWVPGAGGAGAVVATSGGTRAKTGEGREKGSTPAGKRIRSVKASEPRTRGPPATFASSNIYAALPPSSENPFKDDDAALGFQYDVDEDVDVEEEATAAGVGAAPPPHHSMETVSNGDGKGDDDDDDVDDVVFRPNFSRTFTSSPGAVGLQTSASMNSIHSHGSAPSNEEDDDATLLLASASLGDWLGLAAAGRETHTTEQAPWWGAGAGAGSGAGAEAPVGGASAGDFDLGGGGGNWVSSLGLALARDGDPLAAPPAPAPASSTAVLPPPGFAPARMQAFSALPFATQAGSKDALAAAPVTAPPGFKQRPADAPYTSNPWAARR